MEQEIWRYHKNTYKVYLEDAGLKNQIAGWKDCKLCSTYYNPQGKIIGWDIIFPAKLYAKVARLVGLSPKKKNLKRVTHGKRLGKMAKKRDHLGLKKGENCNSRF